ncbi:hypothetical protein MNBD_ALPHA07-1180 [hydrothermal vent metagenome]|uniref:Uncharacterized protein n=1 Tax=hydrothermal vent metagenome TaxID=652676 RepID=A0A3B0SLD2_9ZZZZ
MFKSFFGGALNLIVLLAMMPGMALAQGKDIWAYQSPGDAYYFEGFESAAILQSNNTVAVLAFPKGGTTMNAHVGFFADGFIASIKSSLIDADGTIRSVVVDGGNLKRGELNENGFVSYHYILSKNDVPLFQHASIWRIETPRQTINYSLKGSRLALDRVLAEQKLYDTEKLLE